jgi:hypothetical protein
MPTSISCTMVKSAYFTVESNCLTTLIGSSIFGVNTVVPINLSEIVTDTVSVLWILNSLSSNKSLNISWDDLLNDLLEESKFKIYKTDTVSVTISDKLMILGMIYSTIYWRKVSLKSIKQTRYQ